jgi:ABC-type antimicrobial peptide transport system permease subunit
MILHYLKVAFRNLLKYKQQSMVGIVSVSVGLVAFIFGYQWLSYETSYDGFYPKSSRMYMIANKDVRTGKTTERLPFALVGALKQAFPEIEEVIPIYLRFGSQLIENEEKLSEPKNEEFVDGAFFNYFVPKVICGKSEGLMLQEEDLVLTRSYAVKHWGTPEEAIGKKLTDGYKRNYEVIAVIENYPENSLFHETEIFRADKIIRENMSRVKSSLMWTQEHVRIHVCLHEKVHREKFRAKLSDYLIRHEYNEHVRLELIPLTAVRHTFGTDHSFNIRYIQTFFVTTFILLICVFLNFVNLWFNRVYQRVREIRLRHAVGAERKALIVQLLMECFLQFVLILLLSCCLIEILLPLFSRAFGIRVEVAHLWINFLLVYLAGVGLILLCCFPLLFVFIRKSALQPSGGIQGHQATFVRKVVMVFQVGVCVAFLFCAIAVGRQVYYMMHKDLGFKKEGLIHFTMKNSNREATIRAMESVPLLDGFTSAQFTYNHEPQTSSGLEWEGKREDYWVEFQILSVDSAFLQTFQIELLDGDLERWKKSPMSVFRTSNENRSVLINEEAARIMGLEETVGAKIRYPSGAVTHEGVRLMHGADILGVVKNFQSASLRNPIFPQVIISSGGRYAGYYYYVRVPAGREKEGMAQIREVMEETALSIDSESEIRTMDEVLDELHKSERNSFSLFILLAALSVLISLFGIYSISCSTMQRRRKEIAVRKVLGGSVGEIIWMFMAEYLQIALTANLLFMPFAWYFIHHWISQFPFRIAAGRLEALLVLTFTVVFILLTVWRQVLKASAENPSEVIKSE